jgi:REP element-mobilizing transposase RayT
MCRGNERKKIFIDNDDRHYFLKLLAESLRTYHVILYSYVMMHNHFHLVVQTMRANLSEFMRRFNICYTGWFNYHHDTCGHLYQGRYKALLVDADTYLLTLTRYVHLNPVKARDVQNIDRHAQWQNVQKYPWSSLPGYTDKEKKTSFVDYDMILALVGGRQAYCSFVRQGLSERIDSIFDAVQYQAILGSDSFVARIKTKYIETGSTREQPTYRDMVARKVQPEVVLRCVADIMEVEITTLRQRGRGGGIVRGIAAEMLYKYSSIKQAGIGQLLGGVDYGAVYQLRHRMKKQLTNNKSLRELYEQIEQRIRNVEC